MTKKHKLNLPDNVSLMPVFGKASTSVFKNLMAFSDVYLLDIGPDFGNIDNTYGLIDWFTNSCNRNLTWIDHHFDCWPQEDIKARYNKQGINNFTMRVANTRSCAEIANTHNFVNQPGSRNLIAYSADVDGAISVILFLFGDKLRAWTKDALVHIAELCDTCKASTNTKSELLHQACYIAKDNTKSMNKFLMSVYGWALDNFVETSVYYKQLVVLQKLYNKTIKPNNNDVFNTLVSVKNNIHMFDTTGTKYVDLSNIASMIYQRGQNQIVIFCSKHSTKISTNNEDINLSEIFKTAGTKYKVNLSPKMWPLNKIMEVLNGSQKHIHSSL